MAIFQFGAWTSGQQELTRRASRIARQCYGPVLRRVGAAAPRMSEPELRGYVRVRAGAIVGRHVDLALAADRRADPSLRTKLVARATELLVSAIAGKYGGSARRMAA